MKTLLEIIELSTLFLKKKGIERAKREAEDLIAHFFDLKRIDLYLQFDKPIVEEELESLRKVLIRRASGEPFQYIQGFVSFLDAKIHVNSDVLIPRQETEILTDKICQYLSSQNLKGKVLWDICTGSGCIAISLKKRFPDLEVKASDLSEKALEVAKSNAIVNNCLIDFRLGHLFKPFLNEKSHFIVCNPPYISEKEFIGLEREVRLFEPKMALVGGKVGSEFYQELASEYSNFLLQKGGLWLEIGHLQRNEVLNYFNNQGVIEKDLSGNDRFFFLERG